MWDDGALRTHVRAPRNQAATSQPDSNLVVHNSKEDSLCCQQCRAVCSRRPNATSAIAFAPATVECTPSFCTYLAHPAVSAVSALWLWQPGQACCMLRSSTRPGAQRPAAFPPRVRTATAIESGTCSLMMVASKPFADAVGGTTGGGAIRITLTPGTCDWMLWTSCTNAGTKAALSQAEAGSPCLRIMLRHPEPSGWTEGQTCSSGTRLGEPGGQHGGNARFAPLRHWCRASAAQHEA